MNQQSFEPENLSPSLMDALRRLTKQAGPMSPQDCLAQAKSHLEEAVELSNRLPTVNLELVKALYGSYEAIVSEFDSFPAHAKAWLKGALLYFAQTEDGEHDFNSFLGFDDDCEVLNACLDLTDRSDLKINPEDYD